MWEKYVVARLKKQMFDTEHVNGFVSKPWCAGWERKSAEYALDGLNTDLDIVSTDCRAKVKKIKLVHLVFLFLSSPVLCHTLWCQRCRWLSRRPPWTQSPPLAPDWTCLMSLGLPLDHQSKWQGWAVNQHTCLSPNIPRATSCLSKHTGRCWLFTVSHNMYCHVHRKCVAPNLNSVLVFFLHVQWKFFPLKVLRVCVVPWQVQGQPLHYRRQLWLTVGFWFRLRLLLLLLGSREGGAQRDWSDHLKHPANRGKVC